MNSLLQRELWEKIDKFSIDDPGSSFPFSKKLQKENNWSNSFTARAIEEYKRFIFLCCISDQGASPSEIVDIVWHLHLTYTNNYWTEFCEKTLGKQLHHYPSKGGDSEQSKHLNWYKDTLTQYRNIFHIEAPYDIWPVEASTEDSIIEDIYDKKLFNKVLICFIILLLVFIFTTNIYSSNGKDFLLYYACICLAGLFIMWQLQQNKSNKLAIILQQYIPQKYTVYQITKFLYGPHRSYQTALVDLIKKGIIDTYGVDYKYNAVDEPTTLVEKNPLLQSLKDELKKDDIFNYREGYDMFNVPPNEGFDKLKKLSNKVDYQKFTFPGIVLLIGIIRFFQGISNNKPVEFLVLEMGAFILFSLIILEQFSYTKLVREKVREFWALQNNDGYGNDVINNFSIIGTLAIAGFAEYTVLTNVFNSFNPIRSSAYLSTGSNSDGYTSCSGSSCSGGGSCGSGCGGCGGGD